MFSGTMLSELGGFRYKLSRIWKGDAKFALRVRLVSPGQRLLLQTCICASAPWQWDPPWAGGGLLQSLSRV